MRELVAGHQTEINTLLYKLQQLRERHASSQSIAEKIDLKNDIETTEAELSKNKHRVCLLSLNPLDYSPQRSVFMDLRDAGEKQGMVAAAALTGPPRRGLHWLRRRLQQSLRRGREAPREVRHVFSAKSVEHHPDAVLRRLSRSCGIASWDTTQDLFSRIANCRSQRDLFLIFDNLELLSGEAIAALVTHVWQPLVIEARKSCDPDTSGWLAGFFLCHDEAFSFAAPSPWCSVVDDWTGERPLALPPLSDFDVVALRTWVDNWIEHLPRKLRAPDYPSELLARSSVPEDVFIAICENWDVDWFDLQSEWNQ
jgi:hypothetical protein